LLEWCGILLTEASRAGANYVQEAHTALMGCPARDSCGENWIRELT
jgi:hypothetical protein